MSGPADHDERSGTGSDGPMDDRELTPAQAERLKQLGLEPKDAYFTPEGYLVYTEAYHLKRGHCCQSGCRHCPYGFHAKKGKGRVG